MKKLLNITELVPLTPLPPKEMVDENPYLENEFRRPMFLMIAAKKAI